ncbi:hypothetical protein KI387_032617 [Taxus chinensis]|uniref:Tf2-1-like SH3-like domain-containing protein n=1 Tax=Taxus chinensis TaxID=29808 RepID=A0AA38BPN3_TAXCH|nr:hypothetical protein KI387_032617 [Taxus chinensis]
MQGKAKKLKSLRYGPFEILEQVGKNAFRLDLSPYMRMYLVLNVENLHLFEPSMLDQEEEGLLLLSIKALAPDSQLELEEDVVLQPKERTTQRGVQDRYTPLYGFHGVLSGFLVGVKQIMPDQEMTVLLVIKLRAQWLPSLLVLVSIIVSILTTESTTYLPFILFGTYGSWLYLRYIQRNPETNLKGDPSDEFAFSTFFPEIMRPVVDAIALIFDKILCGGSQSSSEGDGQVAGGVPLPGSDPIEASRRRERGARALEERLAAAKAGEAAMVDENSRQDASDSV